MCGIFCGIVPTANAATEPVATVGEKKIFMEEFNKRYDEVKDKTINPPPKDVFLEDLIRYEVGVQEATKKKIADDPIVAERIRQEIYKGLIEKEIGGKVNDIKVNEAEMKDFYKKNPELRTSHILIEIKPDADDAARAAAKKRAEEIYAEVKKSKRPFEELVGLYTDDTATKQNGGDIGFQTPVTIVPEYYKAAAGMKEGEIKGLIETRFGFHIIKLTGKNNYDQSNKRQIRSAVFDEKRKKIFDEYFVKLKKTYAIKTNPNLLKK
ncbi:MAG: peptidylprolyl isomerase [Bdellovibrionales bacterium]|nr:peptidylprolyl isomerase [Bdellovibrionales bacterium]